MQLGRHTNSVYYLSGMPDCPKQLLLVSKELRRAIASSGIEFNSIAVRGLSGVVVAPILSLQLRKPLSIIRKPKFNADGTAGEGSHSSRLCEGWVGGGPYIIIDDLIDTGATIDAIVEAMNDGWEQEIKSHVGRLRYDKTGVWPSLQMMKHMRIPKSAEPHRPKLVGIFLHHSCQNTPYELVQCDAPSIPIPVFGTAP